jgi:hypothetical protein
MNRSMFLVAAGLVSSFANISIASDHLLTATDKGGLTTSSQPFLNGTDNPGRPGTTVPGQGSPLSGEDHTVPAVESSSLLTHHSTQLNTNANPGNGTLRTPPPVQSGMTTTARSGMSGGGGKH